MTTLRDEPSDIIECDDPFLAVERASPPERRYGGPSTETVIRLLLPRVLEDLRLSRRRRLLLRVGSALVLIGLACWLALDLGARHLAWYLPTAAALWWLGAVWPFQPRGGEDDCPLCRLEDGDC